MSACDSSNHPVSVIVDVIVVFFLLSQTAPHICLKFCVDMLCVDPYQFFKNLGYSCTTNTIYGIICNFVQIFGKFIKKSYSIKQLTGNHSYLVQRLPGGPRF